MKEKTKKEQYTVQLEPELVAKIDKLAAKYGLTRSQILRNFIKASYDDAASLDRSGVLPAVVFARRGIEKAKTAQRRFLGEKPSSSEDE